MSAEYSHGSDSSGWLCLNQEVNKSCRNTNAHTIAKAWRPNTTWLIKESTRMNEASRTRAAFDLINVAPAKQRNGKMRHSTGHHFVIV